MSESDSNEQAARALALEQAYVHEVYEQCAENSLLSDNCGFIDAFLQQLEPGSLVGDIGCGNGTYIGVNKNIVQIGVDRCTSFTRMVRQDGHEVLQCDNLSLPFRDESFDAVLSVSVIHHFSTTERRVKAIKELARVLRIGGRVVISVWSNKQKKLESQDVLVPWPKVYYIESSSSSARKPSWDGKQRSRNAQIAHILANSTHIEFNPVKPSKNAKCFYIDPTYNPAPSCQNSSLSSPNETCYSFFRRAIQVSFQKLAGGRRDNRAWFLDNWNRQRQRRAVDKDDDDDDYRDVGELPIELRRLEDHSIGSLAKSKRQASIQSSSSSSAAAAPSDKRQQQMQLQHSQCSIASSKSRSLNSIHETQKTDMVRSRSSIPALSANASVEEQVQQQANTTTQSKPKLVHQKTHYRGDDACNDTAIQQLLQGLPEPQQEQQQQQSLKRGNVHKQSSMNEEFMSIERLKERESVRRNIMKQASLNEELIYKTKPTLEALRDSFYSTSASKRFQLLKSGLTNRIRQSTTNIEKVSGMSIKNGFVRILQSWTSTESPEAATTTTTSTSSGAEQSKNAAQQAQASNNLCQLSSKHEVERRSSREDGSDSSKDSSLQSDTSVDSEDSFASVIFVPKKQSSTSPLAEIIGPVIPDRPAYQLNTTSAPPSPRVKYASEVVGGVHRMKLISMSPLLKQFPATSKSLPPPSPPGLSPRTLNSPSTMRPFFSGNEISTAQTNASLTEKIAEVKRSFDSQPALPRMLSADSGHGSNGVASAANSQTDPPPAQEVSLPKAPSRLQHPSQDSSMESSRRLSLQQLHRVKSVEPEEDTNDPHSDSESDSDSDSDDEVDPDMIEEETSPLITDAIDEALEELSEKSLSSSDSTGTTTTSTSSNNTEEEDSRRKRLEQIKELLNQKPGFATRTRAAFPIVRRASTATGRLETATKLLPRLMSLELFNPETDDLDSDSSGVSSPESGGSVISVISDERYISKKDKDKEEDTEAQVEQAKRPTALDTHISPVESTWSEECSRHLNHITDRLKGTLVKDIDQFCRTAKMHATDHLTSTRSLTAKQPQTNDNNTQVDEERSLAKGVVERSCSEESSDAGFVVVSSSGEFLSESELRQQQKQQQHQKLLASGKSKAPSIGQQRYVNSMESSDIGDSISESTESPSLAARRFCSGSTASLSTSSSLTTAESARVRLASQVRSASEEMPARSSPSSLMRQQAVQRRSGTTSLSNGTLSAASSQESLSSDEVNIHQYFHVFREDELQQLIGKYVENLHVIGTQTEASNWLIVAEKVQVWTI